MAYGMTDEIVELQRRVKAAEELCALLRVAHKIGNWSPDGSIIVPDHHWEAIEKKMNEIKERDT